MKLLACILSITLCALFAPVVPRLTVSAAPVSTVSSSTAQTAVYFVEALVPTLAVTQPVVCGVQTDTVGEWLSQSVCEDLALEVTQANTAGIRVAVTDTPVVAQLAVQHAPAVVQSAHVQQGTVPMRTAVDSPVPVGVHSPRAALVTAQLTRVSVAAQVPVQVEKGVLYSLRC